MRKKVHVEVLRDKKNKKNDRKINCKDKRKKEKINTRSEIKCMKGKVIMEVM